MGRRLEIFRRTAALLLALLLFVPVVLSGHRHEASQQRAADSCASCVVGHHSRAVDVAAATPELGLALSGAAPVVPERDAPPHLDHQPKASRAPPSLRNTDLA
jgi:hypothetical protein